MRWAGHVARMGEERVCIGSWWGNWREGDHWGDLGVDGWIILGWISRRWDVRIWTGSAFIIIIIIIIIIITITITVIQYGFTHSLIKTQHSNNTFRRMNLFSVKTGRWNKIAQYKPLDRG